MTHAEENEQIALMTWCKLVKLPIGLTVYDLMTHIKNESFEKGTKIQIANRIARQKKAGFKSGTPDLFFSYPCHGKPGLFIEMKRKEKSKATVSANQKKRMKVLKQAGYVVVVAYGFEEAQSYINAYLNGELE